MMTTRWWWFRYVYRAELRGRVMDGEVHACMQATYVLRSACISMIDDVHVLQPSHEPVMAVAVISWQ